MVSRQVQNCKSQKDCDPASCKHGILLCIEGFCMCDEPPMYVNSDGPCNNKSDCDTTKCAPICPSKCIHGNCVCSGPYCM